MVAAVVVLLIANYQITRQRNIAEREHQRAEANLIKARAAVDDYLTTVSESTLLRSSLPGLQPLRGELLQTALRYYQGFVRENQDDPNLRFELAAATFRVGVITAEIDSQETGLRYLADARGLFQRLVADHPARTEYKRELGRCMIRIAYVQAGIGKTRDGIASYKEGIDILEANLSDRPGDDLLEADVAFAHHYLSIRQVEMGMYDEGSQHSQRAIELRQRLADRKPTDRAIAMTSLRASPTYHSLSFRRDGRWRHCKRPRRPRLLERTLVRSNPGMLSMRRTLSSSVRRPRQHSSVDRPQDGKPGLLSRVMRDHGISDERESVRHRSSATRGQELCRVRPALG